MKSILNHRTAAAFLHDLCAIAIAWWLAFLLRFNFELPAEYAQAAISSLFWVLPLFGILFFIFGLYRGIWRYASLSDLQHLTAAVSIGALLMATIVVLFGVALVPRSVLLLHPLLLVVIMGGSRFVYRSWKEHRLYGPTKVRGSPVIILGAGEAADSLLREIHRSGQWYPVAIMDDSHDKRGRRLRGLPIIHPIDSIARVAGSMGAQHAIIAMPAARPGERRRAAELAAAAGLTVMTVPSYDDLLSGRLAVSNIRKVELEDLLGREAVKLDDDGLHGLLSGRVVLVSGAGGTRS
jgi:FlaA1/EpsC-like NDP-sugar epimerase